MPKVVIVDQESNLVYSNKYGLGQVEKKIGHHGLRINFNGKRRDMDYNHYHNAGMLDYVVLGRMLCVKYLKQRGVRYLVHFTPTENLPSILQNGIQPRSEQSGTAIWTDGDRYDGHIDCSSFSITYPNYSMLYQKRKNMQDRRFAILMIDINALMSLNEEDVAFYPTNAASGNSRTEEYKERTGVKALQQMFADEVREGNNVVSRNEQFIPNNCATCPQAEILIRGTVPSKFITKIIIHEDTNFSYLPTSLPSSIEVAKNNDVFWPQGKWENYNQMKRGKNNGYQTCVYGQQLAAVC